MIKKDFTFLSSNKTTNIHAIECIPENGQFTRVIQIIHGMLEYIERYLPFCEYLTSKGFIVVGHDHLGHGQSVNTPEDLGYFGEPDPNKLLIQDIHQLRNITMQKYPNLPYYMLGHSMGSYLLREYLYLSSDGLSGAIIMGTGFISNCTAFMGKNFCKFLSCCKGQRHRSSFAKKLVFESGPYKSFDLKDENRSWITSDPEMARLYNEDEKMKFDFTLNGYIGLIEATKISSDPSYAEKINKDLPLLFVSGSNDPVGDNGEGVRKAFDLMVKIGVKDVIMKLFEGDRHEVLNEKNRQEVFEFLGNWLDEKNTNSNIANIININN